MIEGKGRIVEVLSKFTGREGEPNDDAQSYTLKAMWIMMLSEFEASVKAKVERYIDEIKKKEISDIHICLLIRNFIGDKEQELTLNKIISFYKKSSNDINYRNFTQDKVPKYKAQAIEKLFNNLGIFFDPTDRTQLSVLDSIASTRDAIAHGDFGIQITRKQLEQQLENLDGIMKLIDSKLI
jgi:hypothetical protein